MISTRCGTILDKLATKCNQNMTLALMNNNSYLSFRPVPKYQLEIYIFTQFKIIMIKDRVCLIQRKLEDNYSLKI